MEQSVFDLVLKDLIVQDRPALLDRFIAGRGVESVLSTELPEVLTRHADLLLQLGDGTLLHIEFQSSNDPDMIFRIGLYAMLIANKHRCARLEQVVLYTGRERMRMIRKLDLGGVQVRYRLVDIRKFTVEDCLKSGRPGDYALAILARGGVERMREIVERVNSLPAPQRRRVLTQMALLAGLRSASKRLRMEFKAMGINYAELEENVFFQEALDSREAKGRTEGRLALLRDQLTAKFGPLPKWAQLRLAKAIPADVDAWARKVLTATTLEGVLGKK